MARIDSNAELQEAIQVLESKQKEDLKSLKKEFGVVKERLKPGNLMKEGLKKISHSPALKTTLIVAATGLISFFAFKKLRNRKRRHHEKKMQFTYEVPQRKKSNKFSKSVIQYILTALLSRNADRLKDFVFRLLGNLKTNPPKRTKPVHHDTATAASESEFSEKQKTGY
ncbi:MAG TPA: hypothetical protein VK172_15425 [Lentimicrobium sp.]|jgi:hypothetical protein|nr:hypothetical protein [Lentimicrobium sp.]